MANKKISELTAASTLTGTELVPVVQGGVTKRTTANDLKALSSSLLTALLTSELQGLQFSAQYRGNSTNFDTRGIVAVNVDAGLSSAVGAYVPSGTRGQAMQRLVSDSGTSSPGVGVDTYGSQTPFYCDVSGVGSGGFTYNALLMIEAITNTQCAFFGFCELTGNAMFNLVTEPSQFSYICAFAKDSTDTNLQFMLRNNGTVTKVSLPGVTVAALVNHLLQVQIVAAATGVNYQLTDLETGVIIASGSVSANMPAADQKLYPHMALQTKSSGGVTAVKLAFLKYSISVQP